MGRSLEAQGRAVHVRKATLVRACLPLSIRMTLQFQLVIAGPARIS